MAASTENGPARTYVTREHFERIVGDLSEEVGATHGLVQNFVKEQREFLDEQRARDETRDRLYFEKLERLAGEQRKLERRTHESFNDLEGEAARSEVIRLERELKRSDSLLARHRSWWSWLIRGGVVATAVVIWETLKFFLFKR